MRKLLLSALLVPLVGACGFGLFWSHTTYSIPGFFHLTISQDGEIVREVKIDGTEMLIRVGESGVRIDLGDFPGKTLTTYFGSIDELPLKFMLPDGTVLLFHGNSFDLADEDYELPPHRIASYMHPGLLISP